MMASQVATEPSSLPTGMSRLQARRVISVSYLVYSVAVPGEESFAITKLPPNVG